jgi:hypothetical protein
MDLIEKCVLLNLFYMNTPDTQEKILLELAHKPLFVGDGYVYCFKPKKFENTQKHFKLKIGRTVRTAEERIEEQKGIQMFSLYTIFYFKLERVCHLFFRFANVRGPYDGNEMFLFTKKHKLEMNDIFSYINNIDVLIKRKFFDLYTSFVPIENSILSEENIEEDIIDDISVVTESIKESESIKASEENELFENYEEESTNYSTYINGVHKYTCKICNVRFKDLHKYERHLQNKTTCDLVKREQLKVDKLTCPNCKKVLSNQTRLRGHMEVCKERPDDIHKIVDKLKHQNDTLIIKLDKHERQYEILNAKINKINAEKKPKKVGLLKSVENINDPDYIPNKPMFFNL